MFSRTGALAICTSVYFCEVMKAQDLRPFEVVADIGKEDLSGSSYQRQ